MIKKAVFNLSLTVAEQRELATIRPWVGGFWDTPPNDTVTSIKQKLREQLVASQNVCSYCGLPLGGTSEGEIEHIAAKNHSKHPEFTFCLKNLTLACHLCNFPRRKGQKETISVKRNLYSKCEFLIVHPYFDDPDLHYEWTDEKVKLLIQVRDNSLKARNSIKMFQLDSPVMSELRAKEILFERLKPQLILGVADEQLVASALAFK